jgi:peptidoglycan/LPS O-acetylase OafA/YrhL
MTNSKDKSAQPLTRIHFLDGLRGLAIASVVLWHAFGSTYAPYLPYSDKYNIVPFKYGWVGVNLFFILSGFVIFMTLERCVNPREFALRRWIRLFPSMFFCSIIILIFDIASGLGPYADRGAINLIPGFLFISPSLINTLTGLQIASMDGPFWSLYVEVCFYVVFGSAYYIFGPKRALWTIFSLFLISVLLSILSFVGIGGSLLKRVSAAFGWLGFIEFGWFTCGALLFRFHSTGHRTPLVGGVLVGLISVSTSGLFKFSLNDRLALLVALLIFIAALFPVCQTILRSRGLVFLGFISYPLYLLHNNIMIGSVSWLGAYLPEFAESPLLPVLPILVISAVAWGIARFIEPAVSALLTRRYAKNI